MFWRVTKSAGTLEKNELIMQTVISTTAHPARNNVYPYIILQLQYFPTFLKQVYKPNIKTVIVQSNTTKTRLLSFQQQ